MQNALQIYPLGSTGSRLLSGDYDISHELESKLAHFVDKPAALIFNSGYQLNTGVFKTLYDKDDLILADKRCHASIIDGAMASEASFKRFRHNDMGHLKQLLESHRKDYQRLVIVSEALFSMDGDFCPLSDLVALKKDFKTELYIDEAHSIGIIGESGEGLVASSGLSEELDYIVGTFGKAFGLFGAFIAGNEETKERLINHCRSFIYSTALPPAIIAGINASLDRIIEMTDERQALLSTASTLREKLEEKGFQTRGESQIIPIIFQSLEKTLAISDALKASGILALPIRPPTVPKTETRLRLSLSHAHTEAHIRALLKALDNADH